MERAYKVIAPFRCQKTKDLVLAGSEVILSIEDGERLLKAKCLEEIDAELPPVKAKKGQEPEVPQEDFRAEIEDTSTKLERLKEIAEILGVKTFGFSKKKLRKELEEFYKK